MRSSTKWIALCGALFFGALAAGSGCAEDRGGGGETDDDGDGGDGGEGGNSSSSVGSVGGGSSVSSGAGGAGGAGGAACVPDCALWNAYESVLFAAP
jgi:hypothetical protein